MTLYLSAVWTQSGESGNTLKIKCSGMPDERANIFSVPTTSEAECSSQCSVSDIMPLLLLSKPRKDDKVERKPTTLAHSTATKEKPRRYLRGCALWIDRASRRETRLSEPERRRHQAPFTIARRHSRISQVKRNPDNHCRGFSMYE